MGIERITDRRQTIERIFALLPGPHVIVSATVLVIGKLPPGVYAVDDGEWRIFKRQTREEMLTTALLDALP
jgi:hypothetical protein